MSKNSFPYARSGNGKAHDNIPTPRELYDMLDRQFHFDHDPCPINPDGLRKFDGLGKWGKRNFVNPPYSKKPVWIKKAIEEQQKGNLTVMLLPVDSSTRWFHELVLPNAEIRWIKGRLKFTSGGSKFANMICIFWPRTSANATQDAWPHSALEIEESNEVVRYEWPS